MCPAALQLLLRCGVLFWKSACSEGSEGLRQRVSSAVHSRDTVGCWAEPGAQTGLADRQVCWWSGRPELGLRVGFGGRLRKSAAWKMDVSGCCISIVKFAVKRAKREIFHTFLNLLTGFHVN